MTHPPERPTPAPQRSLLSAGSRLAFGLGAGLTVPAAAFAQLDSQPLNPVTPQPESGTLFETLDPSVTGVEFVNPLDLSHPDKFLYASSMATGGVAVGDFDGNGLPDLFFASGPASNGLFLQRSPWRFEDATAQAGTGLGGGDHWGVGVASFDADGDGDLDLFVANYLSPCQLFLNDGNARFTEAAGPAGLAVTDASHTPSLCDYDGDGDVDLYLLTNRWYRPGGAGFPSEQTIEIRDGQPRILPEWEKYYDAMQTGPERWSSQVVGRPDLLFRNNGDGTFTDVTRDAGIRHRGHGLSATWFDWDRDGHPDLWVGNDFDDDDALYRNNGDGTFTDVTRETVPYTTWFSMGADSGDVDGDGLPDLFIADMSGSTHYKQKTAMGAMGDKAWFMENADPPQVMRNCLFINAGNGRFTEAAYLAGTARTNWTWAVRLADLDLDGRNDLYVQAGMSRNFNEKDDLRALRIDPTKTQWDRHEHLPPLREPNWAFRNTGGFPFEDVSAPWGLDHTGMSYGAALADLDRDGDYDIVSVRLDEPVALLQNHAATPRRIAVRLVAGSGGNRHGVGAVLTVGCDGTTQSRTLTPARGFLGCDETLACFGLPPGDATAALTVRWPDGFSQRFDGLAAGSLYTVRRKNGDAGGGGPAQASDPEPPAPLLAGRPWLADAGAVHHERPYDDFATEPLLPNKMSHWGPGQAWGDVDGDGDQDLFLGAGKGATPHLFRNEGGGRFSKQNDDALVGDLLCEDMGAVFLDADSDGDLDLFVASGGVESPDGSANYRDRLYVNDGSGRFTRAPDGSLPDLRFSSGPVAAADYDGDGDLDLFTGGRCTPGAYPTPGRSALLRNDSGRFSDVTAAAADGLAGIGMVTGALWSDADADGDPDLFLTLEWGPPTLFLNADGTLTNATTAAGLDQLAGWWNGIAGRDLDGDGDLDYVVTNAGLNTKYHAAPGHPALIFYGDLDGTGRRNIVEAEFEGETLFPVRGRSCSSAAMPFVADKFKTYHDFALAALEDIYPPSQLGSVDRFEATELASGILRNDGSARFSFEPLPWQAQVARAFGVAVTELDGDGVPDIVLGHNFSYPQIETGPESGGLGLVLLGRGSAPPAPLRPDQSGLAIPGDARGLTVTDVDGDGSAEIAVATNGGPVEVFELARDRSGATPPPLLEIRLDGAAGNPSAAGARLVLHAPGLPAQVAEVAAGSGYLTADSSGTTVFAAPPAGADTPTMLVVTWPGGGGTSSHPIPVGQVEFNAIHPAR